MPNKRSSPAILLSNSICTVPVPVSSVESSSLLHENAMNNVKSNIENLYNGFIVDFIVNDQGNPMPLGMRIPVN